MKTLFFTALTFAILLGTMGIFFGFFIYHTGKELREINTEFLFTLGTVVIASCGALIVATPITNQNFWYNLKEQREVIHRLYKKERELDSIREKYEQKLMQQ